MLCLHPDLTGVDRYLCVSDSSHSWHVDPPNDCHVIASPDDEFLRLSGSQLEAAPQQRFVDAVRSIYPTGPIPWRHVLPRSVHREFLRSLVDTVKKVNDGTTGQYLKNYWTAISRLHAALQPAVIDATALKRHLDVEPSTILESFKPRDGIFAAPIVYNRFAARTGRLGVESGPMILNLKRTMRDVVASQYGAQGRIISLDFNALEARIILYESGKYAGGDLYSTVAAEALPGTVLPRSVAKACIISELYGISQRRLAERLNVKPSEAGRFMSAIRKYFETPQLTDRLASHHTKDGCIHNKFGRRLIVPDSSPSTLLNTYAQSTGADAAQLGFLNVVNILSTSAPHVRPLFVLHDALILDVHVDDLSTVKSITEVMVPCYEQPFSLKCEVFYTPTTT